MVVAPELSKFSLGGSWILFTAADLSYLFCFLVRFMAWLRVQVTPAGKEFLRSLRPGGSRTVRGAALGKASAASAGVQAVAESYVAAAPANGYKSAVPVVMESIQVHAADAFRLFCRSQSCHQTTLHSLHVMLLFLADSAFSSPCCQFSQPGFPQLFGLCTVHVQIASPGA